MSDALYHLAVIVLAALAVVRGYRSGLPGQIPGLLGLSFGIVCAHLFQPPAEEMVRSMFPSFEHRLGGDMFIQLFAASSVCIIVFLLFSALTAILKSAMSLFPSGVLGSIFGAVAAVVKYMFFLSIAFNLLADFNPYSSLVKFATDRDGNVVEVVMAIAPAPLGVPGVDELAYRRRLEEAKLISCNFISPSRVVYNDGVLAPPTLIDYS